MAEKKYFQEIYHIKPEGEKSVTGLYKQWAEQYDKEMAEHGWQAPQLVSKTFLDLNMDKGTKIIDIGAGTGAVAKLLKPKGYSNIDALDGTQEMLDKAKELNLYRNYFQGMLGKGLTVKEIPEESYDVATCAGVFVPNHMSADIFPEVLRITKKGGIIIMIRGLQYSSSYPELGQEFDDEVETLARSGKWKHHVEDIQVENYLDGNPAKINVMEKIC